MSYEWLYVLIGGLICVFLLCAAFLPRLNRNCREGLIRDEVADRDRALQRACEEELDARLDIVTERARLQAIDEMLANPSFTDRASPTFMQLLHKARAEASRKVGRLHVEEQRLGELHQARVKVDEERQRFLRRLGLS